mmetsp:Transcript_45821/g.132693  ORF Transcript_45821/g.132693 Transcript_45821/m.132693 type:complete len:176 (+) Transcript_45821:42-569(+)
MGCGVVSSQKYQVGSLSGLGDDPKSQLQQSLKGQGQGHQEAPPQQGRELGTRLPKPSSHQRGDRYRPSLEGLEVIEGEADVSLAVAAANDLNLLRKYAESGESGKRRPAGGGRVFAPASGPLSAEPLRHGRASRQQQQANLEEPKPLSNHTVGGLRLQHSSSFQQLGQGRRSLGR